MSSEMTCPGGNSLAVLTDVMPANGMRDAYARSSAAHHSAFS